MRLLTDALVALLAKAPQKQIAERTERGLTEEFRHKAMAIDIVGSVSITISIN